MDNRGIFTQCNVTEQWEWINHNYRLQHKQLSQSLCCRKKADTNEDILSGSKCTELKLARINAYMRGQDRAYPWEIGLIMETDTWRASGVLLICFWMWMMVMKCVCCENSLNHTHLWFGYISGCTLQLQIHLGERK